MADTSIPTNCGTLDASFAKENINDFLKTQINVPGDASIETKNISYFHKRICEWAYSIPLKFKWVVIIEAINKKNLLQQIAGLGAKYENKNWDMFESANVTTNDQVQKTVGCIFAQGVNLPGEDVGIEHAGISEGSNRGFINSPIISGRKNFELLEIGFLETNRSFVDGFLRPWSIIVAHKGLIATEDSQSIKANIIVHQLTNSDEKGSTKSKIRKSFIFENCAPVFISPETLDYSSGSDFPKLQSKFTYSEYAISDQGSI